MIQKYHSIIETQNIDFLVNEYCYLYLLTQEWNNDITIKSRIKIWYIRKKINTIMNNQDQLLLLSLLWSWKITKEMILIWKSVMNIIKHWKISYN